MSKIKLGKVVGTHALAGYVRIYPYINDISDFEAYPSLEVAGENLEVAKVKYKKNIVLLKFRTYNHINEVGHLIGKEVFVDKELAESLLEDDEYLLDDLIGLAVINQAGESLGKVVDMRQTPSQTTLIIKGEKGEWFLPFVDAFVLDVDLDKGISVQLIEGLIDEN